MDNKNYKGNSCKIGIYRILNIKNSKQYIGSTKSSFWSRKTKHYNLLKNKNHYNKHLQNAWNKYGESSFIFEIIEICDILNVEKKEGFYIKKFKTNEKNFGYNIASVKEYRFNYKLSKKHNQDKSIRKKKKTKDLNGLVESERGLPKPFKIYNMNGIFIEEFNSAKAYVELYGGSPSHLSTVLSNRKLFYFQMMC